eukprot:TRINITY_DN961_c0_g1_i1.p3 TRINITY_DN961_c0_g1~~TRINITY_DN961_c0_g1_i1.p3  ORF type:complete len:109 (+),score=7.50 TRINITY_DN961_c0_g1_i1:1190-1516(+)
MDLSKLFVINKLKSCSLSMLLFDVAGPLYPCHFLAGIRLIFVPQRTRPSSEVVLELEEALQKVLRSCSQVPSTKGHQATPLGTGFCVCSSRKRVFQKKKKKKSRNNGS